jgi:hypothetical protein
MNTVDRRVHPFPGAYVVHVYFSAVPTNADDNVFVGRRAEPYTSQQTLVFFDLELTLSRVVWRAPNVHCTIPAAANNCRAVKYYTAHRTLVSFECACALARLQTPYAHCMIQTARDESVLLNDSVTRASFVKMASINYQQCTINVRSVVHRCTQHRIGMSL